MSNASVLNDPKIAKLYPNYCVASLNTSPLISNSIKKSCPCAPLRWVVFYLSYSVFFLPAFLLVLRIRCVFVQCWPMLLKWIFRFLLMIISRILGLQSLLCDGALHRMRIASHCVTAHAQSAQSRSNARMRRCTSNNSVDLVELGILLLARCTCRLGVFPLRVWTSREHPQQNRCPVWGGSSLRLAGLCKQLYLFLLWMWGTFTRLTSVQINRIAFLINFNLGLPRYLDKTFACAMPNLYCVSVNE